MIIQKTFDKEDQCHKLLSKIKCKICCKEFEQITNSHLKTHSITMYEYREQFPDALLVSEGTRQKISNNNVGMRGKEHSEATKQKMSDNHVGMKGKKHTDESKQLMSDNLPDNSYVNNPNWKGGISFEPYCIKFDYNLKERIRNFFNRCCYVCGKSEQEQIEEMINNGKRPLKRLDVHHVNYDKMVCCNDVKPLFVPLCRSCHMKTLKDREYWEEFFTVSLEYLTDGECFLPKSNSKDISLKYQ